MERRDRMQTNKCGSSLPTTDVFEVSMVGVAVIFGVKLADDLRLCLLFE